MATSIYIENVHYSLRPDFCEIYHLDRYMSFIMSHKDDFWDMTKPKNNHISIFSAAS